jgi:hypothetical protein
VGPTEQLIDCDVQLRRAGMDTARRSTEAGRRSPSTAAGRHSPSTRIPVSASVPVAAGVPVAASGAGAERAARESLRAQVAKLERELSGIVAGCFPHVSPAPALDSARGGGSSAPLRPGGTGPHLLSLAELERLRDRLVLRVRGAQHQAVRHSEHVRRSRDLLERMKEEPGQYKFVRLPVTDLGERGCGVWEVRPRLGLIGMLAGWWQLTLSSGCPLPQPRAPGARLTGMRQNTSSPRMRAPRGRRGPKPRAEGRLIG